MRHPSLALLFVVACVTLPACTPPREFHGAKRPCDFPTRPGTHEHGSWKYILDGDPASTCESLVLNGRLFRDDKEIVGAIGDVIDTPLGTFAYFGTRHQLSHWNCGWLNTCTYNDPVFDAEGRIRGIYQERFSAWKKRTRRKGAEPAARP